MNQIIQEYLAWKGTYAPRASINYRIWLYRFIQVCGDKELASYCVPDFVKYHSWLASHFSPNSVHFATIVIKNFLQYCKTQNYSCYSPTLIKLPRNSTKSHRAVSEGEYIRVISIIPHNEFKSLRDLILIHMLWDTGVRVSELCDLNLSQIDENKRSAVIQTKKTGKKRIIVWSEETHRLLMKYIQIRLKFQHHTHKNALFVGWDKNRKWSNRITTRSVQRFVKYYVDRAGIKEKITPHSFRHGWAHKRRDQNASLAFIQRGLGHINPASTFIYEQYNDLEFERNADSYLKVN